MNGISKFAAVLDKNDSLIQQEIELPKNLLFSSLFNSKGEILGLKNQDYFGVEEAKVTF